ncbi:apoptosis-inducing factor 3 isoform X1 [Procambarus clarkii]|uniref:apoptosis-inducing factor 3 isoform X1 n=2 Tax=Procambarus clarkii TaxID=6728 RepID=UPI00374464EB
MGVTASCRSGGDRDSDSEERRMNREESANMAEDVVEAVICKTDELPNEGMKSFDIEGGKVLVVHHKGQLSAIGTKCSHAGAPLENGALCGDKVRCPWHGACFSLVTGDIEDFPGLDSIPKYDIEVVNNEVKVRANKALLAADKRMKPMTRRDPDNPTNFVIVGGGGAGATCVERLRQEGFTGRVIMITQEYHLPYDRPKLSKAMDLTPDKITLRSPHFYENADIEILQGVSAENIDTEEKEVYLNSGEKVPYDKLFIATGGKPRRLGCPGDDLPEVFVIRTPEDTNGLAAAASGKHVVIVGTSFIGMETAAYLASNNRAASVSAIGNSSVPFERSLGAVVGKRIQELFEENGVKFFNNTGVTEFTDENGKLNGVLLDTEEMIAADIAVVGVGVIPNTEFLESSNISRDERGYVPVNEYLESSVRGVFCGGDIAAFPLFIEDGASVAISHWQVALGHGRTAALNMLDQNVALGSVPFFWTVFFGKSLRYTGYGMYDDVIIGGDLESLSFMAYYCRGDRVVALASLGRDPAAAKYAEMLQQGKFLTKEQVADDGDCALKLNC